MPYNKNQNYRNKKMVTYKKTKDAKQDKEIRHLKKMVGKPEVKYVDFVYSQATMNTTGDVEVMNICAQGTEPYQRIGNQIKCIFLTMRGYIIQGPTAATDRIIRFQILWDKAPRGAEPAMYGNTGSGVQAINNNSANGGTIPEVFNPISQEWRDRFKVIKDKLIKVQMNDTGTTSKIPIKFHMRLNRVTRFNDDTANINSLTTNALYFAISADSVATQAPQFALASRVYYIDD